MKFKKTIFLSFFLFTLLITISSVYARPQKVMLSAVSGTVEIVPKGEADGFPATVGYRFKEGDSIRTYENSSAEIYFEKTGVIFVQPSSFLTVDNAQIEDGSTNSTSSVKSGQIRAKVRKLATMKSEFKVKSPVAVAAVRGTIYIVRVKLNGATTVYVVEGKVELTSLLTGLGVTLEAGQGTSVNSEGKVGEIQTGGGLSEDVEYINIDLDKMKEGAVPPAAPVESRSAEADKVAPEKGSKYGSIGAKGP